MIGHKRPTEAMGLRHLSGAVGEHSGGGEAESRGSVELPEKQM